MGIYYFLLAVILILAFLTKDSEYKTYRNKFITILSCILIFFIQALRHFTVGTDLEGYLNSLEVAKYYNFLQGEKLLNYELGYSLFCKFFSITNISKQLYISIIALIIISLLGFIWLRYSKIPWLSIIIYITLGFFTFTFSGIRQSLALAITFFSFKYVE
ncbi:hypothetical protein GW966_08235, partial [Clostridium perfringens]|nr:hypothetical protein [Clostridium perfringens]